jgi:hypothetical protein
VTKELDPVVADVHVVEIPEGAPVNPVHGSTAAESGVFDFEAGREPIDESHVLDPLVAQIGQRELHVNELAEGELSAIDRVALDGAKLTRDPKGSILGWS